MIVRIEINLIQIKTENRKLLSIVPDVCIKLSITELDIKTLVKS